MICNIYVYLYDSVTVYIKLYKYYDIVHYYMIVCYALRRVFCLGALCSASRLREGVGIASHLPALTARRSGKKAMADAKGVRKGSSCGACNWPSFSSCGACSTKRGAGGASQKPPCRCRSSTRDMHLELESCFKMTMNRPETF